MTSHYLMQLIHKCHVKLSVSQYRIVRKRFGGGGNVRHVDVLDRTVAANIENMPPEMLIIITINV